MKITVLDAETLGVDLDLSPLAAIGELAVHAATAPEQVAARLVDTDVAVVNKIKINEAVLAGNTRLKLVCVTATGYDNIDLTACRARGIGVCNVVGYSTDSVAQVTLAMALSLTTNLAFFTGHVASGAYTANGVANCVAPAFHELRGKTWGIAGYGHIGARVGALAAALGCRVLALARRPREGVEQVELETLCRTADILSIHLPLTPETRGLFGAREIGWMKPDAILLNVARGAVTDEAAVAAALQEGRLGGLGVDVYSTEPFGEGHPFYPLRNHPRACFTPHMAWAAYEARARCIAEVAWNIRAWQAGERRCRVD
ncbi:MAG: D-2-hydroxyacid dehydrogenase [Akkermansia sp.]|nr:D-2-hydroxyacid dehydrogenase [Akkermansia sp.]